MEEEHETTKGEEKDEYYRIEENAEKAWNDGEKVWMKIREEIERKFPPDTWSFHFHSCGDCFIAAHLYFHFHTNNLTYLNDDGAETSMIQPQYVTHAMAVGPTIVGILADGSQVAVFTFLHLILPR